MLSEIQQELIKSIDKDKSTKEYVDKSIKEIRENLLNLKKDIEQEINTISVKK
jgi:hypothetical protein